MLVDLDGFDKLLEHRSRLVICVVLSDRATLNFRDFKILLKETDGNLGAQLRKLETAGYLKVRKTFKDRKPTSRYSLTSRGRKSLSIHLRTLHDLTEGFTAKA